MARGSVRKRCQCRDEAGRRVRSCKKSHGSWAYTIDVGLDPETKHRKQSMRSGFSTKKDAEEAMAAELQKLNAGLWVDDRKVTTGEWLDQWITESSNRLSPRTTVEYRSHIENVLTPHLGRLRLRDLRREHVEAMVTSVAQPKTDPTTGKTTKLSAARIDAYRRTLRAALASAKRRGLVGDNVAAGKLDSMPAGRPRAATQWEAEETAQFLASITGNEFAPVFRLAAFTGLRRSELLGLRWSDLDPDNDGNVVGLTVAQVLTELPGPHACPTCAASHTGRLLKETKTAAGERWVPVVGAVRPALDELRAVRERDRQDFGRDYADHDLVVALPDGSPTRPSVITSAFFEASEAANLPRIRLHDLRGGAASLLLVRGVPIETVAMILGHSSPEVTRKHYARVMRGETRELVELATRALSQTTVSNP